MQNQPLKTTLHMKEGTSDKIYQLELKKFKDLWEVWYANARRGRALVPKLKASFTTYEGAAKLYIRTVDEKVAKGYIATETLAYVEAAPVQTRETGVYVQLLNSIDLDEAERYIKDDNFWAQEKHDGERRPVKIEDYIITGINKKGKSAGLPEVCAEELRSLSRDFVIDTEEVKDKLYCFDLLNLEGKDMREFPYSKRFSILEEVLKVRFTKTPLDNVLSVYTAKTTKEKRALFNQVKKDRGEGVVFKLHSAKYTAGRPNSGGSQFKCKFKASASVIVKKHNDRRSVSVVVFKGNEQLPIGSVSIPINHSIPKVGEVIEVEYLYAFPNGKIYQPVYKGVRTDTNVEDCIVEQLKYKKE